MKAFILGFILGWWLVIILVSIIEDSNARPDEPSMEKSISVAHNNIHTVNSASPMSDVLYFGTAANGMIDLEVIAIIESNKRADAVSPVGARGICQIMEPTWREFCDAPFSEAFNPQLNIEVSRRYYNWLYKYFSTRVPDWHNLTSSIKIRLLLAGYNWGIGNLRKNNWDWRCAPAETQAYIVRYFTEVSNVN